MSQPPRFNREPPPPGIVFNTSMTTPDAALALAALWAYERQRLARVAGVCVTGGGYKAAVFCDIVNQFYRPGERLGNDALAVGLASADDLPPDAAMVSVPVDRVDSGAQPLYRRTIERLADTSLAESQLRNAITFNAESSVVLSAPATSLARSLQIGANRDLYTEAVQRLVVVESARLRQDDAAYRYLIENWPTEIVVVGSELGTDVLLPSADLDRAFGWAPNHPVVDAYSAFRATPYAVPSRDLLAMTFAVEPDSPLFQLSAGDGATRRLGLDPSATSATETLIDIATRQPA
jgi:hypothetical protein